MSDSSRSLGAYTQSTSISTSSEIPGLSHNRTQPHPYAVFDGLAAVGPVSPTTTSESSDIPNIPGAPNAADAADVPITSVDAGSIPDAIEAPVDNTPPHGTVPQVIGETDSVST